MSTLSILKQVAEGSVSVHSRVEAQIEKIRAREGNLRAFIDLYADEALVYARILDEKIQGGKPLGRLAGLTVAIKNNICIQGKRATCASKTLENYVAPYNAHVVERLLAEDAIIIGSTNMDEFACGSDNSYSAFYPTKNPLDESRVPGGSSGGSAVAVAAGFSDLALGSDTGGSVRCPASFCGVNGFKPTYGLVSRYGLIDMGMSLDQIGAFSNDVEGSALLLSVIAGKDPRDPNTMRGPPDLTRLAYKDSVKDLVVGLAKDFFEGVDPLVAYEVGEAAQHLKDNGAKLVEVSIPSAKYSVPIYFLSVFAEFSSAMQRYDGLRYGLSADVNLPLVQAVSQARETSFGREVKRRILLGTYITMKEYQSEWFGKTQAAREMLRKEITGAFSKCDLLITPAMPMLPWKLGEKSSNPVEMYAADILTASANLAGIPAGVTSCGKISGLPVGVQIMGRSFEEGNIYSALSVIEKMQKD